MRISVAAQSIEAKPTLGQIKPERGRNGPQTDSIGAGEVAVFGPARQKLRGHREATTGSVELMGILAARPPHLVGRAPHTTRHTTAMHLLQSGGDITVIALWLGHEDPSTTNIYLEADLAMKEEALSRLQPLDGSLTRYKAPDKVMAFLQSL